MIQSFRFIHTVLRSSPGKSLYVLRPTTILQFINNKLYYRTGKLVWYITHPLSAYTHGYRSSRYSAKRTVCHPKSEVLSANNCHHSMRHQTDPQKFYLDTYIDNSAKRQCLPISFSPTHVCVCPGVLFAFIEWRMPWPYVYPPTYTHHSTWLQLGLSRFASRSWFKTLIKRFTFETIGTLLLAPSNHP